MRKSVGQKIQEKEIVKQKFIAAVHCILPRFKRTIPVCRTDASCTACSTWLSLWESWRRCRLRGPSPPLRGTSPMGRGKRGFAVSTPNSSLPHQRPPSGRTLLIYLKEVITLDLRIPIGRDGLRQQRSVRPHAYRLLRHRNPQQRVGAVHDPPT